MSTIFRIEKNSDYTVMSNFHFKDSRISLKAKGLLSQMLSLPDDWDYTLSGLAAINREGKDSIRSALNELEEAGYLERRQINNGKFGGNEYIIRELPTTPLSEKPTTEKPTTEKPTTEKPSTENPTQLNTKELNTKEYILCNSKIIINYLNEKAGTSFKPESKETIKHISARLKCGYSVDDFKAVIDNRCTAWKTDKKMCEYLRPKTLFSSANFEGYLQAAKGVKKPDIKSSFNFDEESPLW